MGDRLARKAREQVAPLVVPGETVRHAVRAVSDGGDGVNQTVVLTDQAVYIMSQKLSGATKDVEERIALGSVPVSIGKGLFWTAMLSVGDRTLRVPVPFKAEAESLVAAAGG